MDEEQEQCFNCKKMIGVSKLPIHEGYCRRNIRKCDQCDEMIDINHKEDHFDEFHKKVKCDQCGTELEIKKMEGHPAVCPNRKQICTYCNLEVLVRELGTHTSHCGSRTRNCQFCNGIYKLRELDAHEAGCLEEQRRVNERKEIEKAKRFKAEEMKRKEEQMRMEEMARLDAQRKEQEKRRLAEDKANQDAMDRRMKQKREDEVKRREAELKAKEASRPVPTTTYQNAYEPSNRRPGAGPNPYAMPQTGPTATRMGTQPTRDQKPTGYDKYIQDQSKPTTNARPGGIETSGYRQSDNLLFDSQKPIISRAGPTGGAYRPPSSQQGGYGSSLGGAGKAVLSNADEESRRLAKQLQEQFDREASENYLGRQQVKDRNAAFNRQAEDERIARELQEQMDMELARKFAEGSSPEREPPARNTGQGSRAGGPGGMFDDLQRRMSPGFDGFFDDGFDPRGDNARPGSQGNRAGAYGGYPAPSYGQPKPQAPSNYGQNNPAYPQSPDLDDDEEYQRVILESMKDAKTGARKYY